MPEATSHPKPHPVRHRPTPDLIVIFLAGVVGFVIVFSTIAAIVWKIAVPDANLGQAGARIAGLVNTLVGVIVGYLAGRGVGHFPVRHPPADGTAPGHPPAEDPQDPGPSMHPTGR